MMMMMMTIKIILKTQSHYGTLQTLLELKLLWQLRFPSHDTDDDNNGDEQDDDDDDDDNKNYYKDAKSLQYTADFAGIEIAVTAEIPETWHSWW